MGILAFLTVVFGVLDESQTAGKVKENKTEALKRVKRWSDNSKKIKSIQDKINKI